MYIELKKRWKCDLKKWVQTSDDLCKCRGCDLDSKLLVLEKIGKETFFSTIKMCKLLNQYSIYKEIKTCIKAFTVQIH